MPFLEVLDEKAINDSSSSESEWRNVLCGNMGRIGSAWGMESKYI